MLSATLPPPVVSTRSTCPYCGVGCGVLIESQGDQVVGVQGDPAHPANFGRLCSKGSTLHQTATQAVRMHQRLLQPQWRPARGQPALASDWDSTLQRLAQQFADTIRTHGPDSVAFYISGQLLTEDYYVFNKLVKGLIGTNNLDTNSRLCMSSAVAGYKQSLGADAPPACYDDFNHTDCLFITGSNAAWAHPILFRRIEDARRARPQMKVVVVDPRRTETTEFADLHLQIQPGTDVALCHGMLHAMLWEELLDRDFIRDHTQGFEALRDLVRQMTPAEAARVCGIAEADLLQAARWFAQSPATLSLWCMGLNQSSSGTAKNTALINLHLATGQIGRHGAGPFSLTGQPNAMGGREVGGLSNLLSAHRDMANPDHRAEVAALWGLDSVPGQPGKSAVELFEAAARGEIKALWIACTNPAQSMPDQALVRQGLERCELVVLQEAFADTATAAFADVLLPAATWAEKEGTVTNSERRISRVRAAVPPPGQARDDWAIAVDFGQRLQALLRPGSAPLLDYPDTESIWNEHRESTRGRDLDITGLSYPLLDQHGPQQWPCPEGTAPDTQGDLGTARLYTNHQFATPDGRARFITQPYRPTAEKRDARFPFSLTTGRLRDQWHGMSRSGTVAQLFGHERTPVLRMSPHDLPRRQLKEGDLVELRSRRGAIVLPLLADEGVAPSQAYLAMHWGEEFLSGAGPVAEDGSTPQRLAGVNSVTSPAFCPDSKQPELKHSAVSVKALALPWRLTAAAWLEAEALPPLRQALRALMGEFTYASCVPVPAPASLAGGEQGPRAGLLFQAASATPIPATLLDQVARLLQLAGGQVLRYDDPRRGRRRLLRLRGQAAEARLDALLLTGEAPAGDWLRLLWQDNLPVAEHGRLLLAPEALSPDSLVSRGRQVCNCWDVSEPEIRGCLARLEGGPAERLAALQNQLRCGTRCGSCLPELRRLEKSVVFQPNAANTTRTAPAA